MIKYQDRQIILEDERYKNTILRKYLERTQNIHLKKPPRLRDLHEIIYQHAFENIRNKGCKLRTCSLFKTEIRYGEIPSEYKRISKKGYKSQNLDFGTIP